MSLGSLFIGAFVTEKVLELFPSDYIARHGGDAPAFSQGIALQAPNYPIIIYSLVLVSALAVSYFWSGTRPYETKTFAISIISGINIFLGLFFPVALLLAYFIVPELKHAYAL